MGIYIVPTKILIVYNSIHPFIQKTFIDYLPTSRQVLCHWWSYNTRIDCDQVSEKGKCRGLRMGA